MDSDRHQEIKPPGSPMSRRHLIGLSAKIAAAALVPSVLTIASNPPPEQPQPNKLQEGIAEIESTYGIKIFSPDTPIDISEIDLQINAQLEAGEEVNLNTIIGSRVPRQRVLGNLLSANKEVADDPNAYASNESFMIHPITMDNLSVIKAALSLTPRTLYTPHGNADLPKEKPELYVVTGPTLKNAPGIETSAEYYRGPKSAPFSGLCECRQGDLSEEGNRFEPSILIDQALVSETGTTEASRQGIKSLIHELVHVKVGGEMVSVKDGLGGYKSRLTANALSNLGFDVSEDAVLYQDFHPLIQKLAESGDMVIVEPTTDQHDIIGHAWRTRLGYIGQTMSELVPRSADMYLEGKEYFLGEFGRVFGSKAAEKYYSFIQSEIFSGREYSSNSIDEVLSGTTRR